MMADHRQIPNLAKRRLILRQLECWSKRGRVEFLFDELIQATGLRERMTREILAELKTGRVKIRRQAGQYFYPICAWNGSNWQTGKEASYDRVWRALKMLGPGTHQNFKIQQTCLDMNGNGPALVTVRTYLSLLASHGFGRFVHHRGPQGPGGFAPNITLIAGLAPIPAQRGKALYDMNTMQWLEPKP